jgi:hypothetical protein
MVYCTDGLVGGQLHVISVDQAEGGQTGVTTDIHFTVLSFTDGTGKVIMCAMILKSDKKPEDIPAYWQNMSIQWRRHTLFCLL